MQIAHGRVFNFFVGGSYGTIQYPDYGGGYTNLDRGKNLGTVHQRSIILCYFKK